MQKHFEIIHKSPRKKYQVQNLLQGATGTQSRELLHRRAQFLRCLRIQDRE